MADEQSPPPDAPSTSVTDEGSGARLVRNTIVNGLGSVSGVLISLILTPFLINGFGVTAYGVFVIALSLSFLGGYASLADLGIEAAVARYVAEARSTRDVEQINRVVTNGLAVFSAVALVLTPVIVGLAIPFVDLFDVPHDLHHAAAWCFVLVASQLLFELPARIAFAVLEGSQKFTAFQALELLRTCTQSIGWILCLVFDLGIVGLGAVLPAASLVVLIAAWTMARRTVPDLHVAPRYLDRHSVRHLMHFGGSLFVIRFTGTIYRQMDKLIVGVALGAKFVTTYEIANRLHAGAAMVQSIAASALLPAAAYSRSRVETLRDMYLRGSQYAVAVSVPVTLGALIFAEPLIRTWVGSHLLDAVAPTRLFLIYLLFVATHIVGATMMVALGHTRPIVVIAVITVLINLLLSILLVGPLGIEGVIVGSLVGQALAWPPQLRLFLRRFEVSLGQWARAVVLPALPGVIAQGLTVPFLLPLANRSTNLAEVAALVVVSVVVSLVSFVALGLRRDARDALLLVLRRAVLPSRVAR